MTAQKRWLTQSMNEERLPIKIACLHDTCQLKKKTGSSFEYIQDEIFSFMIFWSERQKLVYCSNIFVLIVSRLCWYSVVVTFYAQHYVITQFNTEVTGIGLNRYLNLDFKYPKTAKNINFGVSDHFWRVNSDFVLFSSSKNSFWNFLNIAVLFVKD